MEGGAYTLRRKPPEEVALWTASDEARVLGEAADVRALARAATRPWDITFVFVSVVQAAAYVGELPRPSPAPFSCSAHAHAWFNIVLLLTIHLWLLNTQPCSRITS